MRRRLALATYFIALCVQGTGAAAQNIHRCGNTYSQQPCAGGRTLETVEGATGAQKRQADAVTRRDAKAADEMEKARLQAEAQPAAAYLPPPRDGKAQAARPSATMKKPETFVATVPAKPGEKPGKKKSKAQKKKAQA